MTQAETSHEVTRLLHAWKAGNQSAQEELWAVLYRELKGLARGILYRQGGRPRHATTSLVHQAYLRLVGNEVEWTDRHHFFAVASRAMRFVLIDEARSQVTEKRRSEVEALPAIDDEWPEVPDPTAYRPEEVLAVHQALGKLAQLHPRHEKLVELRYFAGLSVRETAEVLGVDPRTVVRDWKSVRLWLHHRLESAS